MKTDFWCGGRAVVGEYRMKLDLILAAIVMLGLAGPVYAADEAGGGMTYEAKLQSCFACHGENGDKPLLPDYPILSGQYSDYLAESLKSYRSGRRQHPIMNAQVVALGLSDDDIEQLSAYFAGKSGLINLGD